VGRLVGAFDGLSLGAAVGDVDGRLVGDLLDGCCVGACEGRSLGAVVGEIVGPRVSRTRLLSKARSSRAVAGSTLHAKASAATTAAAIMRKTTTGRAIVLVLSSFVVAVLLVLCQEQLAGLQNRPCASFERWSCARILRAAAGRRSGRRTCQGRRHARHKSSIFLDLRVSSRNAALLSRPPFTASRRRYRRPSAPSAAPASFPWRFRGTRRFLRWYAW
jgi:hypothetical protein